MVANDWNINRRCIVWIAAVSFSKADDVGSNDCSSLTDRAADDDERFSPTGAEFSGSD